MEPEDDEPDRKPKAKVEQDDDDPELEEYSERVQKRINRLTYEREEARRQQEAAKAMRDEAVRVAQHLNQQNQQLNQTITSGEGYLVKQIKDRAALALSAAQAKYRKAYEEGDTDAILAAQDEMLQAKFEANEAQRYEQDYQRRMQTPSQPIPQQYPQQYTQPQPYSIPVSQVAQHQVPKPTKKAQEWAEKNTWFSSGEHPDMTALAYGIHEDMIKNQGIKPDTEEYFAQLDERMRKHFPAFFKQSGGSAGRPSTVVAPSARNDGARPRRIHLDEHQVALAKKLGLTPEQYAAEYVKAYGGKS